jgi:hypothetical protein
MPDCPAILAIRLRTRTGAGAAYRSGMRGSAEGSGRELAAPATPLSGK